MKRIIITAILFLIPFTVLTPVFAVDVVQDICSNPDAVEKPEVCKNTGSGSSTDPNDNPIYGPDGVLTTAINILSMIAGIAAVFTIIIAGFRYITSAGDTSTTASAQKAIIYGVVGLVIVASAQIIVVFVLSKL